VNTPRAAAANAPEEDLADAKQILASLTNLAGKLEDNEKDLTEKLHIIENEGGSVVSSVSVKLNDVKSRHQ